MVLCQGDRVYRKDASEQAAGALRAGGVSCVRAALLCGDLFGNLFLVELCLSVGDEADCAWRSTTYKAIG